MSEQPGTDTAQELANVHTFLIQQFLRLGYLPQADSIASSLGVSPEDLTTRLQRLADSHGLVLHPHASTPWVVHPFSTTPTLNYIEGKNLAWWAPCIWCALGIAGLAGGLVRIHSRIGAEAEPVVLEIVDGVPLEDNGLVVHFAIPPRSAWNNVHQHCALVLPFRHKQDVETWCARHGQPYGEVVPLLNTAKLARTWYGTYAQAIWRKWTVDQAQQIFRESGLTSTFWELSGKGIY